MTDKDLEEIATKCKTNLPLHGHEAYGTGLHNSYLSDVPDLLEEIASLKGQLERTDARAMRRQIDTTHDGSRLVAMNLIEREAARAVMVLTRNSDLDGPLKDLNLFEVRLYGVR